MTSRERVAAAMRHEVPDRTPVMCQLSLGHYFINTNFRNSDIWFDAKTFAKALSELCERYRFDGILVNIHLRDTNWKSRLISRREENGTEYLEWIDGLRMRIPGDDSPQLTSPDFSPLPRVNISDADPDNCDIFRQTGYVWNTYHSPYLWTIDPEADLSDPSSYPDTYTDAVSEVQRLSNDISIHTEVFSPFTHLMELLGYQEALTALLAYPEKCHALLVKFTGHTVAQIGLQARCGVDAILVSSAFAGAGFISRELYREFVMPYEEVCYRKIKSLDIPAYIHTCGAIGDRLDLMAETSADGVDTLDPPPLGTVDLAYAKKKYGRRFFFKGNLDSVGELLRADDKTFEKAVKERLEIGGNKGGYILSTACSVAPGVNPERLMKLIEFAERFR